MSKHPKNDPDGVDRDDQSSEIHENTRHSAEGVEKRAASTKGRPAAGLIGDGKGVDPRYVGQR